MFFPILTPPSRVFFKASGQISPLSPCGPEIWERRDLKVFCKSLDNRLDVSLEASAAEPEAVQLRWDLDIRGHYLFLNDHWERGYGDLQWGVMQPERVYPWYFMAFDGERTHGYGVRTLPNAMAFWQLDSKGVSLWLDLRCGGSGVRLNGRLLDAVSVVAREGLPGESSFAAAKAFCQDMAVLPARRHPVVYGGNNWYCDYGESTEEGILEQAKNIARLAGSNQNRPFMVMDDGWQICHAHSCNGGPWSHGNYRFPHLEELPGKMEQMGVRAGIWFRPLVTMEQVPDEALLSRYQGQGGVILDPSSPFVLEKAAEDMRRLDGWGYHLIKHDFSSFDIWGRWGFQMGATLTASGWRFYDPTKTTAEIIKGFYRTLREAAPEALIMGCNTVGHLSAGIFDLSRTGDDTSGLEWERTRKMGVNTLAFRLPQHNVFFAADADCVGITGKVAWEYNRQWLELLSKTGTPLFVSASPAAMGPEQEKDLAAAFARADQVLPEAEPLDWMDTACPSVWKFGGETQCFDWFSREGVQIYGNA